MGTPLPLPQKEADPPQFSANMYCGQTDGWIKMALGTDVGLGLSHIVLDGNQHPSSKKGAGYLTKSCITWYGGKPQHRRHCVRWGPISPPLNGHNRPIFGPYLLSPNGWMDADATWYGSMPRLKRLCVRWGPCFPSEKKAQPPTQFVAHDYCGQAAG